MKARLLLLLSLAACDRSSAQPPPREQAAATEAPTLEVVPVIAQKLDTTVHLPGELTPYEAVAIYPRVTGFLEEIRVDRGSKVKSGQLLARLSAPELAAQRAEAESKLSAAKSTYDRLKAASSTPGAVAEHDIEVAEAGLKADQSRVASLRTLEGYLWVRAPFDGIITERNVHPGALVGPPQGPNATPMLRVEQIGHLRLTVAVPESDAGAVAEGAEAAFSVRTWPGQKFHGVVRRSSHSIDTRTRTMAVELDVDNAASKLAPGMYAEALWPVRRENPSLFVPTSAVVQTTERTFVDRVRSGVIEQVLVQRGQTLKDRVEVYGELAGGDWVLRRGSEELKSGTHVSTKMASPDGGTPAP
jgi:RND family efflux transporter MFP subunit